MSVQSRFRGIARCSFVAAGAAVLAASAPALAQEPTPEDFYFLDDISHGGSGCPQGTVTAAVSPDGEAISIFLDEYIAAVGPDTPPSDTKTCNLVLPMNIPAGWQYSLVSVGYAGTYFLETGVRAAQSSEYFFQGSRRGPAMTSRWTGPTSDEKNFDVSDRVFLAEDSWSWSPCGKARDLIIRTKLQVNNTRNRKGYGYIENDFVEATEEYSSVLDYGVRWRQCVEDDEEEPL